MRILILLAVAAGGLARADSLTYSVSPASGKLSYRFTLANTGATGGAFFDLFLSLPTPIGNIDTAAIGRPAGWGDAAGGLLFFGPDINPSTSFIEWSADFSGTYDLAAGGSLLGFSFLATQPVGAPIQFALNGSAFDTAQQVIAVPEPPTFDSLLALIVVIGFRAAVIRAR